MNNNSEEFLDKLRDLLEEYNANICYFYPYGTETHGYEAMKITIGNDVVIYEEPYDQCLNANKLNKK